MQPQQYVAPEFRISRFNCPFCGAFAHHERYPSATAHIRGMLSGQHVEVPNVGFSHCHSCDQFAIWHKFGLVFPGVLHGPLPNPDMPEEVKEVYQEARTICQASPRGAAALLRLAIQMLMGHLGEKGKNIDADIKSLVQKGLRVDIQRALDIVRVVGNSAVHPGQIDLNDEPETVSALFGLINLIVHDRITQPKQIEDLYSLIPQSTQEQIVKRDSGK